jgi:hypothetical protein
MASSDERGTISVNIAALIEGVLKLMLQSKLTNVAAVLLVVMVIGPVAAADAKYVKLVHADTGKALAVADDSDEAGAKAVLVKEGGSQGQQWKLEKDGDHYKIVNRKSGKVLDVEGDSKDEGGGIIQWEEKTEDNDNQRWSWEGNGKERRLKSKSSNLVLDVGDDGSIVQRKADEKSKAQLWRVVEVKE